MEQYKLITRMPNPHEDWAAGIEAEMNKLATEGWAYLSMTSCNGYIVIIMSTRSDKSE